MRRIAICDDDADALERTRTLCRSYFHMSGREVFIACFQNAEDLLAGHAHYDIYLLDILMPGGNGISLAKELMRADERYCVIYLTMSEEYALDAFSVNALQYLVKPVEEDAFYAALGRAETLLRAAEPEDTRLAVRTPDGVVTVRLSRLCYVEHLNRALHFHMADGTVFRSSVAAMKLSDLAEKLLALPDFLSPHRAFLVNMNYIAVFHPAEIRMKDGQAIPVARANSVSTRRRYLDYLLEDKERGRC